MLEASGLAQGALATPLSVFALQIAFSPTPTLFAERYGNVARRCSDLLSKKNPSELVRLDYAVVEQCKIKSNYNSSKLLFFNKSNFILMIILHF